MSVQLPIETVRAIEALGEIVAGARAAGLESETLDFKREDSSEGETARVLLEAAICFANARGGVIVLGIDDRLTGTAAFLGAAIPTDVVRERIYSLSRPNIVVTAREHEQEGKRLILIDVPQGMEMHSDTKGRSSRRVGRACEPLTIAQAAALQDDRRRIDWSDQPSDLTTDDLAPDAVEAARVMLRRYDDERRSLAEAPVADLLRELGVIRDGELLRAGEVLFCQRQGTTPILYTHRTSPGGEVRSSYRESAPGLTAYREVLRRIQDNSDVTDVTLPDGQQVSLLDFPLVAVREALSNALLHRDHRQPEPILVDHSASILAFVSPGPLVEGVTSENILHVPSKPRNALLSRVARTLGIAEEMSRGIDRMYREMIRLGKRPPEILNAPPFNVRVELIGGAPNQVVARFVSSLPTDAQDDVDVMIVLFQLLAQPTLSGVQIAPILQRTPAATEMVLRRLADPPLELIAPSDRKGGRVWQLTAPVATALRAALGYRTVTQDEIDRKIIEHVTANGTIDSKTLQIFFDLDVNAASYRLRALRGAGVLAKLGDQERGPGIRYGPGPSFPGKKQRRNAPS
ncbi:MAG: RNA-binding domain-containing protein [Solirubrobacteraceae bacterium]